MSARQNLQNGNYNFHLKIRGFRFKSEGGFTLIELMVAIVIVSILATIGLVTYSSAQRSARINKRMQDLQAISTALELYKTATGSYPNNIYTGTVTCANSIAAGALGALVPAYMPILPTDPLGGTNCYMYSSDAAASSTQYKIRTNVTTSGEMTAADYNLQPGMIDPARDVNAYTNDCNITTGTSTVSAWAIYSGSAACGY